MMRLLKGALVLVLAVGLWSCDSGGDDGTNNPNERNNPLITGFYCVVEAPAGATVTYRITELDQYGTAIEERPLQTITFESASAKVIDLYAAGEDPHGVAVMMKLTAGPGKLRAELWHDSTVQSSAETERLNHEICVRGGTGS